MIASGPFWRRDVLRPDPVPGVAEVVLHDRLLPACLPLSMLGRPACRAGRRRMRCRQSGMMVRAGFPQACSASLRRALTKRKSPSE